MSSDLSQGFLLGPFTVEPLRGAVTGPDGETRHLEPKVMDVFVCLARHADELVTRDRILDTVWRGQEVSDEPLTRAIGELRRALDDDRARQSYIETVPKRGYRLKGDVRPLSPKHAVADAPRSLSKEPFARRNLAIVMGIVFAVVAAYVLSIREPSTVESTDRGQETTAGVAATNRSVAVLPFRNRSAEEEDAYFVDGIHDDIVTQLARIASLDKVISRTTMERYRDSEQSIPEIGRELGVTTILEGGVQRSGEQVRINVQLIDAVSDEHLWAQTFDRRTTAENIFAIQSEIAEAVAAALQLSLTAADQARIRSIPTQNLDALEHYFRARDRMARRTTAAIDEAVAYLEAAIEMDPDFALAYVALANALELRLFYGGLSYEEEIPRAKALVLKALDLDDQSDEAYAELGSLETGIDNAAAEAALKRAISLNPGNSEALWRYCDLLGPWSLRNEEALPSCERAVELDPLSPITRTVLGQTYSGLGRADDAELAFRKAIEIDPGFAYGYANLGFLYRYAKGRMHDAVRWLRKSIELDPGSPNTMAALSNTYLDLGDAEQAEFWVDRAIRLAPSGAAPNVAMSLLQLFKEDYATSASYARRAFENELPEFAGYALTPIVIHESRQGRIAEIREFYARTFPAMLTSEMTEYTEAMRWAAKDFAYVLIENGERDRAKMLLDNLYLDIQSSPRLSALSGYAIIDAQIHAMLGDKEEALARLQQAVDEGWRTFWWLELKRDPGVESIRDDPRFKSIEAQIEADMAGQLAELGEWEANGELAPIPATLL